MEKLESLEKSCELVGSYLTELADRIEHVPYVKMDINKNDLYIRNGVFCSMSVVYGVEFELEYKNWSTESQELKSEVKQISNYPMLKGSLERILKELRAKREEECMRSVRELSQKMAREFAKEMEKYHPNGGVRQCPCEKNPWHIPDPACPEHMPIGPEPMPEL